MINPAREIDTLPEFPISTSADILSFLQAWRRMHSCERETSEWLLCNREQSAIWNRLPSNVRVVLCRKLSQGSV